jgi:flagellin-specific chaperone FliS
MGRTLNIYIIHAKDLTIRANRFQNTLRTIDEVAKKNGFTLKTQFILQNEPAEIQGKIEELNKKISYDPVNDEDYDKQRYMLSVPLISNIEKHKEAWKRIAATSTSAAASAPAPDLHLIIEDDALLFPECAVNFDEVLKLDHSKWDMLNLGLSTNQPTQAHQGLLNQRDLVKILPSKEAYCLKPSTAKVFLEKTDMYKFTMRLQLSYLIKTTPALTVMFPAKRVFIDGSKLGIFPSTLHPTNVLLFNNEYIQMHQYIHKTDEDVKRNFATIDKLYKAISHINSPDIMHLYGFLLKKCGRYNEAEKVLSEGIQEMKKQQGFLNNQSEIATNLIDLYKYMQKDIDDIDIKSAKYSVHTLKELICEED